MTAPGGALPAPRRRGRVAAVLGLLLVAMMLWPAQPASAHATLQGSSPAANSVVDVSPKQVSLTYDQQVSVGFGGIKVLSPSGVRVDSGKVSTTSGGKVVVDTIAKQLPPGTYTILWRVLSLDTHTVFGAVTFSVKTTSSSSVAHSAAASQAGSVETAQKALDVMRGVLYAGLALLVGAVAFLLVLWPGGRTSSGARRVVWSGWLLAVLGSVGGLLVQGPYSAARPLSAAFDVSLLEDTLQTRYGIAGAIRLGLLLAGAVLLLGLGRLRRAVLSLAGAVIAAGIFVTVSASGHSGTGSLLAIAWPADILHLAAMSAWLGGLAMLIVVMRSPRELAAVAPVWSKYAATSVAVLVASGLFAGWREVRTLDALTATWYGQLLLLKAGAVAVMLAFAAAGRSWVQRQSARAAASGAVLDSPATSAESSADQQRSADGSGRLVSAARQAGGAQGAVTVRHGSVDVLEPQDRVSDHRPPTGGAQPSSVPPEPHTVGPKAIRQLRVSVLIEAAVALIVLGLTSVLVGTAPARETYFPVYDHSTQVSADLRVHIGLKPARVGLNVLQLNYSNKAGKPVDVSQVTVRWTEQTGGKYVVPVTLKRVATGRYAVSRLELPAAGRWQLALFTQVGQFDSTTTVVSVRVR